VSGVTSEKTIALNVILTLLGSRLTYPARRVTDRHYNPVWRVNLTGRPVLDVYSITDQSGYPANYVPVFPQGILLRDPAYPPASLGRRACNASYGYIDVDYRYGLTKLPESVDRAHSVLTDELTKAYAGQPCRLPERITSVSRQGVSWTMIDPYDFLDNGRTGLYEVDSVLSHYNRGGAKARARTFSPDFKPPVRLYQQLDQLTPQSGKSRVSATQTSRWKS
jgi:hypothetical protein